MKAFRLQTGIRVEPFDDPVDESFVGGQTLADATADVLEACDVTGEPAAASDDVPVHGDCLILPDNLFLTRRTLRTFLQATAAADGPARLALEAGHATAYTRPLQRVDELDGAVAFDLFRVRRTEIPRGLAWDSLRDFLRRRAEPVVLDPGDGVEWLPQSRPGPPRQKTALPRTTLLAADVRHWVHLLWINHQLPWVRLQEHWDDHPGIGRAWRRRGRNRHRRLMRMNVIGKHCDIHPTAVVEGSILGDRVRLGPFASVRDSILGERVEVSDHTKFLRCVVGARCHTLNDSYFIGCTCYPESTLASFMMRNTVLGRRLFLTSGVMFWDEPITGTVRVAQAGREEDTGRWLLGGCAGHESVLGTRAIFLPGRAVSNRTMIVMRPEEGVIKLPAEAQAGRAHVYHQGRVVPLEQALPAWRPPEID